ncbi:hypothetical protein Tco_1012657 [Tanacetum coccineum]
MEEVSLTINEAELKKIANEMLRQRCTSGDEHQYHIDQMKNFLKSDIVWESKKKFCISTPHPRKTTPLVSKKVQRPREDSVVTFTSFILQLSQVMMISKNDLPDGVNRCVRNLNPYARMVLNMKGILSKDLLHKRGEKA